MTKKQTASVLLPAHISPLHYSIFLEPDLENFIFTGEEKIDIKLTKSTKTIILHSADIEVLSVTIGKKLIQATKIDYDDKAETVTFEFPDKISEGKTTLNLKFAGILNDKMRGFYRSRYVHEGKTYHMGVTQFESTDARRAFPCFDEPAHKATFDVSLKVPSDRTVISNTLEEEIVEHEGGYKVVKFEKSPKMSSYLLAFIVGHFEYVERITKEGVKVRVYVTPGKKKQAKFALDTASKIMSYYHDYFGIDYPLPTMDLIAIPDFANGAMENWGAVTYRETALLVDEKTSSLHNKQWVALIIAHELAHQWFGNLVTMKWWTHLWLNEGFASFMEYLAVDKLFPEWRVWTQFIYTEQARAFLLDGLTNTHAIEIPVHHPGEISEIFDAVSYSKGASVIRMLQDYVGEKDFQKGLQQYLRKHKYGNAETQDLWNALEKASGKPVGKIMRNWTSTPGYPMIDIDQSADSLTVKQERFYASGKPNNADLTNWLIPISINSDDNKDTKILLTKKVTKLPGYSKSKWIKANSNDTSFVRVRYSHELLRALKDPVINNDPKLTEQGRFALVRDAFALVESGYLSATDALDFLDSYKKENSYIVWAEIVTHLLELKSLLYGKDCYPKFLQFGTDLLSIVVNKVEYAKKKGESHESTLLRSSILYAQGTFGDKSVIDRARKIFDEAISGKDVDSDLRSLSYTLTAENGGAKEFKKFMNIYLHSDLEEEKDRALRALCSFNDKKLLSEIIDLAFSSKVRSQDAMKAVYMLTSNPQGIDITWLYIKKNWSHVVTKFGGGHLFARFISPFSKFTTRSKAREVEVFFDKNNVEGIKRTVAQTLEKINSNASLLERDLVKIGSFLNA